MEFVHIHNRHDTIAAVATPPGVGGIAIVRVSGSVSIQTVGRLIGVDLAQQSSHSVSLKTFVDAAGKPLDRVLLLPMHGPRSFTGEDVVEIHCHGGHLIARKILETLCTVGVRPAGPGEFSFRAFLNGKIDLSQAEAIQDLIGARNEQALRVAEEHLEGRLSSKIRGFQKKATDLAAIFEAWVDFPEEDLAFCSFEEAKNDLEALYDEIEQVLATFHTGKIIHNGVALCILGAPNVGKSSLMNALLGKDRAIVSPIAGTTRDIVEDDLQMGGIHFRLVDTAGIRQTDELIESEGVRRSKVAMTRADIVLLVLDASRPQDHEMLAILDEVCHEKTIVVWNKVDVAASSLPKLAKVCVEVSSVTGSGLESLHKAIEGVIWGATTLKRDEVVITNVRHQEALLQVKIALRRSIEGLTSSLSPEFIAIEMREVLRHLGTIIGTNITEDILQSIFSRFCIGK